jgi:hypothetical protein
MKKVDTTIISLTGGLGNQLFQLSAGLHIAQEDELFLEWTLGKPRLDKDLLPAIAAFRLPRNVSLMAKHKSNWLVGKATGYMLRLGFEPRGFEKVSGYFSTCRWLATLVISMYFKSFYKICPGRDLGHHDLFNDSKGNFIVGYFQSYKWVLQPNILSKLKSLEIAQGDPELLRLKTLSAIEHPLVVHIRLGDYKNESSFGILPKEYYARSIERMWKTGMYKTIWVFSDEPILAKEILNGIKYENIRWISEVDGSAGKTLEVMRLGHGYVIGNSTFSWWGALLSHESEAKVIAPNPWFKNIPAPKELIPPHWDLEVSWRPN